MKKIDHSRLRANPENEDFGGKYENSNLISQYLVNNYFRSVAKLVDLTQEVESAHEIGVGEGRSTQRLSSLIKDISGSEFLEHLLPIAKKNNPDLKIFQESVYELKYQKESVDLVFLLEVLEHLDYPGIALREIKRITRKYLILGVPNEPLWRILNMSRLKYIRSFGNTPGHLNHWSRTAIVDLVQKKFGKVVAVESPIPWTLILAKKD